MAKVMPSLGTSWLRWGLRSRKQPDIPQDLALFQSFLHLCLSGDTFAFGMVLRHPKRQDILRQCCGAVDVMQRCAFNSGALLHRHCNRTWPKSCSP